MNRYRIRGPSNKSFCKKKSGQRVDYQQKPELPCMASSSTISSNSRSFPLSGDEFRNRFVHGILSGDGGPLLVFWKRMKSDVSTGMALKISNVAQKVGFVAACILCCCQPLLFGFGFLAGAIAKTPLKRIKAQSITHWKGLDFRIQCLATVVCAIGFFKVIPVASMITGCLVMLHADTTPSRARRVQAAT